LQLVTVKESGTAAPMIAVFLVAIVAGGYFMYKRRKQK
jgi:LPXTG-motif cell wall-anchored protein